MSFFGQCCEQNHIKTLVYMIKKKMVKFILFTLNKLAFFCLNMIKKRVTEALTFKAALAVNFVSFSPLRSYVRTKNEHYKRVFGSLFCLECNKYCSTFVIDIESSLIHLFACKQIYIDTPF